MIRPTIRGQRGFTVLGFDRAGKIRSRHFGRLVDVLSLGTQKVVPPSNHPCGLPYTWQADPLVDQPPEGLWQVPGDIVERLAEALAPFIGQHPPAAPLLPSIDHRAVPLSRLEQERHRRYAVAALDRELAALATMTPNSGRNRRAFVIACRFGRWVHSGILPANELQTGLIDACTSNGLVAEDGVSSVLATLASGFRRSAGDPLPELGRGRRE